MHDLETVLLVFELVFLLSFFFGMKIVTLLQPLCRVFCRAGHLLRQTHAAMGKVRDTQRPVRLLDPNPDPLSEQVRDCH